SPRKRDRGDIASVSSRPGLESYCCGEHRTVGLDAAEMAIPVAGRGWNKVNTDHEASSSKSALLEVISEDQYPRRFPGRRYCGRPFLRESCSRGLSRGGEPDVQPAMHLADKRRRDRVLVELQRRRPVDRPVVLQQWLDTGHICFGRASAFLPNSL